MKLKKVVAVVCAASMLVSSLMIPEKAYAAETGTIEAFDRDSMEDTRTTAERPAPSEPGENTLEGNLALEKAAEASHTAGQFQAEFAVDGDFGSAGDNSGTGRWQSGDNVSTFQNVWLKLDLSRVSVLKSMKIQFDRKMCGNFIIQTSETGANDGAWEELARITDVTMGQDILYTKTFAQPLQAKRFVRLYFTDVNADAANKSIAIRELELNGTQEVNAGEEEPANAGEVLAQVTDLTLDAAGTQVVFPGISENYTISLKGSDQKQIISNDAIVTNYNFYDYDVDVLVQAVNKNNPKDRAEKNMVLHVPNKRAYYPALFPAVENPNPEPKIIPSVQEWYGYKGDFVLSDSTKIAVNDNHDLGLVKAAENFKKDIKEFTGYELEIVHGTGGVNDIALISVDGDKYDTGKEGYILLNNDNGLKVYSNTYTGIFYGTMSVEQVFYQQRYQGKYSFPKGIMRDYPKFEVRGYMLDVARAPYRLERLYDYAKVMAFYKMNEFHIHLNDCKDQKNVTDWAAAKTGEGQFRLVSDIFPSLTTDAKDSVYYNESKAFGGQPQYTKEEYLAFQQYAQTLGLDIMSEIDAPGHALIFNKYVEENQEEVKQALGITAPGEIATRNEQKGELLALSGNNYEVAAKFIRTLFDEYLGTDAQGGYDRNDAVFIGDRIQIGADEYWNINDGADASDKELHQLEYIQDISAKVKAAGKKARIWSQLKQSADKVEEKNLLEGFKTADLVDDVELDVWMNAHENLQKRIDEGFKFVMVNDSILYGNPARDKRDIVNVEYLFEEWTPYITQTITIKKGEPGLLGAKTALWADVNNMGVTERDINERITRTAAVVAEKTWGGTDGNQDYNEFSFKYSRLQNGPGVAVGKEIESKTDLVLDYDFANTAKDTVYDISGNAYHGAVTGGAIVTEDGMAWMQFDGSTTIDTEIDSLTYPYTIQFDVKAENGQNTGNAILFDGYDGRLSVDTQGNLVADRSFFHQKLGQLPNNEKTNITLVGTQQATKLYINGAFVKAMVRTTSSETDFANVMGTFVFPLKNIGEGFHGKLANIKAYQKAMNAREVKDSYDGITAKKVNVSQNKGVAGELRDGGAADNADEKLHVAWKAIDGDGNTLTGTHAAEESEKDSYFNGKLAQSYIALDLYRPYRISEINLQFDQAPASYTLYTSQDGVNWVSLGGVRTGADVVLAEAVETQYLKLTGSNFKLREIEVYEGVDKTSLQQVLEEAKALVEEYGLSFADKKGKAEFFDAYMSGVSAMKNAYALQAEADRSKAALEKAIENLSNVPVTAITLNKTTAVLTVGESETLSVTKIEPADATNREVIWNSGNPAVAAVDEKTGKVTAQAPGSTIITATAADGSGVKAICTITVKERETTAPGDRPGTGDTPGVVQYSLKYQLNKGKNNKKNPAVYDGSNLKLSNPTRKNYAFKGWYSDSKFKKKVTTVSAQNYTLYAKWAKVTKKATIIKSAKNSKKGKLALKLKKVSGAQYEIVCSTHKRFKKGVKKATAKKTTFTIKNLKKGKTYYVRVRTFKKDSAGYKVYSKYTKVRTVRILK